MSANRHIDLTLRGRSAEPRPALDELDEAILWELQGDARATNVMLADRLGVSTSTIVNRLRVLRERKVLLSSHASVDLSAVGLPIMAIVAVRLKPQARPELKAFAQRAILLPPVLNLYFLGGADDFLIHVAAASTDQLRDFVASELSMDAAVAFTQTHIVFDYLVGAQHPGEATSFREVREY